MSTLYQLGRFVLRLVLPAKKDEQALTTTEPSRKLAPSVDVGEKAVVLTNRPLVPSPTKVQNDRERLFAALRSGESVVLLHSRAGTGKTTLIRSLKDEGFRHVVVAPTGIAALNAGGQTIHKFFGIPPRIVNLEDIRPRHRLGSILRRIDLIVIDEISMVRADLLDVIDATLRVNSDPEKPFGEKKLLLVGDFLQLPPVVEEADAPILEHRGYEFAHAFGAKCLFARQDLKFIELSNVHRQSDPEFLELLHNIRCCHRLEDTVQRLNRRCNRPHRQGKRI